MDNKKTLEFFKANPYAMKLIFALAEEHKPEDVTTVSNAVSILEAHGISVNRQQVVALFRQLDDLGFGTFFIGRRGKPSRLYWKINFKLTSEALGASISGAKPPLLSSSPKAPPPGPSGKVLRHTFHLRQDFELFLDLPSDLTDRDAQRISKFVESLPQ